MLLIETVAPFQVWENILSENSDKELLACISPSEAWKGVKYIYMNNRSFHIYKQHDKHKQRFNTKERERERLKKEKKRRRK